MPWEEVEALLEDERRMFEALDATDDVYDTVPYKAVQKVFLAWPPGEGSDGVFFGHKAIECELLNSRSSTQMAMFPGPEPDAFFT